ncbi:hypothetical protein BDF19DRAFT_386933, partial [Syncephalis fuscata]
IASNGHFFGQIPQPIQSVSEMKAILASGLTSRHQPYWLHLPIRTTGQLFLHSCRHFFGLHLSELTSAIRVSFSAMLLLAVI